MSHPIKSPRKLIEVALPLDAINVASVRESYIYKGNPSSLHKWWAQRPLAAARAVLFAQLVNDPGYQQGGGFKYGKNRVEAAIQRKRLFKIVEDLVLWENTNSSEVLERARIEILRSWREVCELNRDHPRAAELFNAEKLPSFNDPFAGGGTIPLEAQRLGFEVYASDLNPVAVLINKALIEIPPTFAGRPPVGPAVVDEKKGGKLAITEHWSGSTGLAEDVRRYGEWMRKEAQAEIGHLYPPVGITAEMAHERADLQPLVGKSVTVIAWLWARTVRSPSPAFSHVEVPLASTFIVSSKQGSECFVEPEVKGDRYSFNVKVGPPPSSAANGSKAIGSGADFRCIFSDAPISGDYIKTEAQAGRMGTRLMAVAVDTANGRLYLPPDAATEEIARSAVPTWKPDVEFFQQALGFRVGNYGMTKWSDIFTSRQLVTLTTFSDLTKRARERIRKDAVGAGVPDDDVSLADRGAGAKAYAEAVSIYLAFVLSKMADYNSTLVPWYTEENRPGHLFSKQAIPMVWDFAELNVLSEIGGGFIASNRIVADALGACPEGCIPGHAVQLNAQALPASPQRVVSTDPPYYDNIGYADLSDFFYLWLRRALRPSYPDLFATVTVPKAEELVATPGRHGTKDQAELFFLDGMTLAMSSLAEASHPAFPVTIYYAFKQSKTKLDGTVSVGWETFIGAVIRAGFALSGTWPMRTERGARSRGQGSNALASSIVLVCRKRLSDAPTVSRREFIRELNGVLPEALDEMTKGSGDERSPVAPVDLSQAIIGPGMAVFSKYAAVLEADGSPMSVRTALQLINRFLAEDDFDADTQFCLHWFEHHGWTEGAFGDADTLARAKGTSVDGVREAGVIKSGGGKVRLLKWAEYPADWNPSADTRLPVWEALHHLIRALKQSGESASGALLAALGGKAEAVRQLAYRLYTLCERLGQAEDARAYNELITSWTGIESAASSVPKPADSQGTLFEN